MFSLDKLTLYDKALASAASLAQHSRSWDKRHAVTDPEQKACAMALLDRIASMLGGLGSG